MAKVESLFPADTFANVAKTAGDELQFGLILGYNQLGELKAFGGGVKDCKRRPTAADWLLLIECFKLNLIDGIVNSEN